MLRKNIRLRKEYLFRKAAEHEDRAKAEKKRKIREAVGNNEHIPSELRQDESELRQEMVLEDEDTAIPRSGVDDEYALAGTKDPGVLITTSRKPSSPAAIFKRTKNSDPKRNAYEPR
jgi:U3 small nucleolar ribonucleoprotein protein IMP4